MTNTFSHEHLIALTPDWPIAGVTFRDISPLLAQKFPETIDALGALYTVDEINNVDAFAGVDARGFIFAAALAQKYNKNLVIVRKSGKLPPPALNETYALEYGTATLSLKPAALKPDGTPPRVILCDDVLATGGTFGAAATLCAKAGYNVTGLLTLIDLKFLNTFEWRGIKPRALLTYK